MCKDGDLPNLVSLLGGGKPDESAEALREAKASQATALEAIALVAEAKWTYYNELKKQGFTDSQALELCKQPFV